MPFSCAKPPNPARRRSYGIIDAPCPSCIISCLTSSCLPKGGRSTRPESPAGCRCMCQKASKPSCFIGLLALSSVAIPFATAAPKPAIAPKSWELEFEFADPQRIDVQLPGQNKPRSSLPPLDGQTVSGSTPWSIRDRAAPPWASLHRNDRQSLFGHGDGRSLAAL